MDVGKSDACVEDHAWLYQGGVFGANLQLFLLKLCANTEAKVLVALKPLLTSVNHSLSGVVSIANRLSNLKRFD